MIIVYDITKYSSFHNIQRWIEEIRRYTTSSVILALVGNKSDLIEERQVQEAEVNSMKEVIPEILFSIETSAKENTNIDALFYNLAKELKDRTDSAPVDADEQRIRLSDGKGIKIGRCTGMCSSTSSSNS